MPKELTIANPLIRTTQYPYPYRSYSIYLDYIATFVLTCSQTSFTILSLVSLHISIPIVEWERSGLLYRNSFAQFILNLMSMMNKSFNFKAIIWDIFSFNRVHLSDAYNLEYFYVDITLAAVKLQQAGKSTSKIVLKSLSRWKNRFETYRTVTLDQR